MAWGGEGFKHAQKTLAPPDLCMPHLQGGHCNCNERAAFYYFLAGAPSNIDLKMYP